MLDLMIKIICLYVCFSGALLHCCTGSNAQTCVRQEAYGRNTFQNHDLFHISRPHTWKRAALVSSHVDNP